MIFGVVINGNDEKYSNVVPELILEDALRVNPYGRPAGFAIKLLNLSTFPQEKGMRGDLT